jgi:hypothetical protein
VNARAGFVPAFALLAATLASACGGPKPLVVLPTGPATPATDGADVLDSAAAACRAAVSLSAEVRLRGRIAGRRARGRLLVGVKAPASAYIDAPAPFGASAFIFAAVDGSSVLLLPRDRRVLEDGRPADVLEAVTGVALTPGDLRQALTGCVGDIDAASAQQIGDTWRVLGDNPRAYLRRESAAAPWRIVAVVHRDSGRPEWRAEYANFAGGLPQTIRLASADPQRFELQLSLSQVELNPALGDDVFHPDVPSGYDPVTLEQLREAGPLADTGDR